LTRKNELFVSCVNVSQTWKIHEVQEKLFLVPFFLDFGGIVSAIIAFCAT